MKGKNPSTTVLINAQTDFQFVQPIDPPSITFPDVTRESDARILRKMRPADRTPAYRDAFIDASLALYKTQLDTHFHESMHLWKAIQAGALRQANCLNDEAQFISSITDLLNLKEDVSYEK